MYHNYRACVLEPPSHNHRAHKPKCLNPECPRSRALQQEKPVHGNWRLVPTPHYYRSSNSSIRDPAQPKKLHEQKKGELRRCKTTLFAQHPAHKSGVSTERVDHSPCPQLWRRASEISPQRKGNKKWRAPQRQTALTCISVGRIQPPQINPHIYSPLIFGKHAKTIQWRKKNLFNK